jgi:poly(3-hydroxybutyrate) depolymerase
MKTTTSHINRSTRLVSITAVTILVSSTVSLAVTTRAGSTAAAGTAVTAATIRTLAASDTPTGVRSATISYRSHTGSRRHAVVLYPATYRPAGTTALPLVISPHGRGLDGAKNAKLWGNLPAIGHFAVVNPDGQGDHLDSLSWGAPGQIEDLARMPRIVQAALPWLRIDERRIYAVGGSMGGQETLLLAARHPGLLAGAVAVDPVADFAHQYTQYPRLRCLGACKQAYGNLGRALQAMARQETGGTPADVPAAYAVRSPLTYAKRLAGLRIPIQIWWSRKDRIVVDSDTAQSGRLLREIGSIDRSATTTGVRGAWIHTAPLRASRQLPRALAGIGLMPCRYASGSRRLHVVAGPTPTCWSDPTGQV